MSSDNDPYTVAQMIAELQKLPPDMRVMVHGYEVGYHDATAPKVIEMRLNVHNNSYSGPHDIAQHSRRGGDVIMAAII